MSHGLKISFCFSLIFIALHRPSVVLPSVNNLLELSSPKLLGRIESIHVAYQINGSDALNTVQCCPFTHLRLFCCNHTCYCVGMVSVMSTSRYVTSASRYQSRSSMYIQGLIPRNTTELVEAVLIVQNPRAIRQWFIAGCWAGTCFSLT